MKLNTLLVGAVAIICWLSACQSQKATVAKTTAATPTPAPKFALKNQMDSVSYSIGVSIGQNIKGQGLDSLNVDALAKAMKSVYQSDSLLISNEQANQFLGSYFQGLQAKKAEASQKAGQQFLAENKAKPNVTTLPSGLQYEVLKAGTGPKPKPTDKVKAHYRGTLVDGKVFDSSYDRNQPLEIGVSEVIPGWTEALQLMPVGSKWRLVIPSQLGYGERGAGRDIPPNSTLIFEMELLSIEAPAKPEKTETPAKPSKKGKK